MKHSAIFLFIATLLAPVWSGCQNMDTLNYLKAIQDGKMQFADGSSQAIPHWGDPAWTHIFCVRHAEKAKDDPHDPQLTAEGQARAERLGRIMADVGLDTIYATHYKRAQLTAEPVQRRAKAPPVQTYSPDDQDEWVLELLENSAGKKIFIIGHQNTVPRLLNQLKGGGFDYDNIPDSDFGQFFIIATQGIGHSEILKARY